MRVLIGGVVGAVAAATGWMAIEHTTNQEFGWMAIAVGLITGLVVHKLAASGSRGSYARGALAAVLTLIACVGCRLVYAKVMAKTNVAIAGIAAAESAGRTENAKEGASELGQAYESAAPVVPFRERGSSPVGKVSDMSIKSGLSQWDMLWISMSVLTAYLIGKGRDEAVAEEDREENADEADAEPTDP